MSNQNFVTEHVKIVKNSRLFVQNSKFFQVFGQSDNPDEITSFTCALSVITNKKKTTNDLSP